MMKQYTFYPNQGQQILARILLTIWLPVMCSPEITVAVPQSGNSRSEISTDWVSVDLTPSSSSGRQGEHQQARNIAAENKLSIAAAQGEVAQVEKILTTQDININAVDDQGRSALHQAVMAGHKEVAGRLIRHGADVALKDYQENKTPLDYANKEKQRYFAAIAALVQIFSTLGGPLAADVIAAEVIQHKDEIQQHLSGISAWLEKLDSGEDQEYKHFKYRYYIQKARYLKFLGEEKVVNKRPSVVGCSLCFCCHSCQILNIVLISIV